MQPPNFLNDKNPRPSASKPLEELLSRRAEFDSTAPPDATLGEAIEDVVKTRAHISARGSDRSLVHVSVRPSPRHPERRTVTASPETEETPYKNFHRSKNDWIREQGTAYKHCQNTDELSTYATEFVTRYREFIIALLEAHSRGEFTDCQTKTTYIQLVDTLTLVQARLDMFTTQQNIIVPEDFFEDESIWGDLATLTQPWETVQTMPPVSSM